MRGLRTALAVALVLASAGCVRRAPTAAPLPPIPESAAPASPSPLTSAAATTEPLATCPADPAEIEVRLAVRGGGSYGLELGVDPLPPPEVVDRSIVPIEETVVGGIDLDAELRVDASLDLAVEITAFDAEFLPFGTATPTQVPATFEGPAATIRLPDLDIEGQFRVSVSWTSRCGSGGGAGAIGLAVANSSVVAGCPPTQEGLLQRVIDLNEEHITVGSLEVPIGIVGWSGRWIVVNGIDDFPEFAGWDRDRSFSAPPDVSFLVRESIDDFAAKSIRTSIFHRDDVIAYLEPDSTGDLKAVGVYTRSPGPKGNVGIPAPAAPGTYVYEMTGTWQTPCLNLESYMVVTAEIR